MIWSDYDKTLFRMKRTNDNIGVSEDPDTEGNHFLILRGMRVEQRDGHLVISMSRKDLAGAQFEIGEFLLGTPAL